MLRAFCICGRGRILAQNSRRFLTQKTGSRGLAAVRQILRQETGQAASGVRGGFAARSRTEM